MPVIRSYPNIVPYESSKKIIDQMEKTICKIRTENQQGTGFFCKIPFPDKNKLLPVLITVNHVINEELLYRNNMEILLEIKGGENIKRLNLNNRIKYTNRAYDITIIEIQKNDSINNFLELDDIIIKDIFKNIDENKIYSDETIYLLQYAEGNLGVSYGIIKDIMEDHKYEFRHMCSTRAGSAGSPVLNIHNNKVIGLHQSGDKMARYNNGIFLNYPIKEFIELNTKNNEILLKEFNEKYNLNIINDKIVKLDLRWKGLGNSGLEDLCKIEFKELKELILNNNNISDLKMLEKAKFEKLEILDLGSD